MLKKLKQLILSPWHYYKERQKIKRKLAKIKVYQDQGHNARQVVYASKEFYDWMFAQKRK